MDNLFIIGGQVKGESFIGRKEIVKDFYDLFIKGDHRVAKSIVGLTRIGKSSLISNIFDNVSKDILLINENLNEYSEYFEVWQGICYKIKSFISDKKNLYELNQYIDAVIEKDNLPWIKLATSIKNIFAILSDNNIKTILIMDEFDRAQSIFTETKHFELFRTLFSDTKYNVFAITISRRSLYMIEGSTYQSSTFHGVLDSVHLKGFNDDDMEEYFSAFNKYGIKLTDEDAEKIIYYTGNSPFLLSIMGHYIVDSFCKTNDINIDEIFQNKCKAINDYYRECIKHLERDGDLKRIIPFVIGPNYGVTQNDKEELINLGYLQEYGDEWIAISKYFTTFLSSSLLNLSIWDNVINLEKKIKLLIEKEIINLINHYHVGGNDLGSIQKHLLSKVKNINSADIDRYGIYILDNKKNRNVECSYIDVISLNDSFKIIKDCWNDIFSKYFNNELLDNWCFRFDKCANARNPIAHGHEEYLSDLDRREVDLYCSQIFDILSKYNLNDGSYCSIDEIFEAASKYEALDQLSMDSSFEEPDYTLIGEIVEFIALEKGKNSKNLKGKVNNKYLGTIPANQLKDKDRNSFIQKKINVKILEIQNSSYILEFID